MTSLLLADSEWSPPASHQVSAIVRSPAARPEPPLPAQTGPLQGLAGRRVLGLFDIENLYYSAREWGRQIRFDRLAGLLGDCCDSGRWHAFYARHPEQVEVEDRFRRTGFLPHPTHIRTLRGQPHRRQRTNSDGRILFTAGAVISRSPCDTVLIASGDGELVCELARCIAAFPKLRNVYTLSLPGSTSRRIEAGRNPHIEANLLLGLDVLNPLSRGSSRLYGC